eukprot:TRINITY_DN2681_c0_g1_i19.p1 TRINITY_DN2681_c0_g1~~TRINITY_DN2681_c0_g1_i19.p1  ORF type:complete len:580 (-),score=199.84 TRINITY_DN2681_c0_g1_i19:416-2155(-)
MSESDINFKALKKIDPYVANIDASCSNVALYNFNTNKAEWERTQVEGTLFLFKREAEPKYGFTIMNRLNPENHIEPVTRQLDFQIQPPFLLYKNSEGEIKGLWFYSSTECQKIGNRIQELVKEVEKELEAKKSSSKSGGGSNLTALFEKADKAMKAEEQQKSSKQHQLSGQNNHQQQQQTVKTTTSTDSGKNLLRLLSQPENNNTVAKSNNIPTTPSSKQETTESVNAFFAMASNNQQLRVTPQPVLNGSTPSGVVTSTALEGNLLAAPQPAPAGGLLPPPGAPAAPAAGLLPPPGAPGAAQQQQNGTTAPAGAPAPSLPPVFGLPPGAPGPVIQAMPISQGLAMGAVPVPGGGFAPYHHPPHPHQGMMAHHPPGAPLNPLHLQQGGGGPQQMQGGSGGGALQGLMNQPAGAMTVEKLEEEQRRKSLSPRARGGDSTSTNAKTSENKPENLGDLSSKLKEQLGVKMSASVQKSGTVLATTNNNNKGEGEGGPVLMSPHLFAAAAGGSSSLAAVNNKTAVSQVTDDVDSTSSSRQRREVTPLTRGQMAEAMEYLLAHDESFVDKLHTAYLLSLQQKLNKV